MKNKKESRNFNSGQHKKLENANYKFDHIMDKYKTVFIQNQTLNESIKVLHTQIKQTAIKRALENTVNAGNSFGFDSNVIKTTKPVPKTDNFQALTTYVLKLTSQVTASKSSENVLRCQVDNLNKKLILVEQNNQKKEQDVNLLHSKAAEFEAESQLLQESQHHDQAVYEQLEEDYGNQAKVCEQYRLEIIDLKQQILKLRNCNDSLQSSCNLQRNRFYERIHRLQNMQLEKMSRRAGIQNSKQNNVENDSISMDNVNNIVNTEFESDFNKLSTSLENILSSKFDPAFFAVTNSLQSPSIEVSNELKEITTILNQHLSLLQIKIEDQNSRSSKKSKNRSSESSKHRTSSAHRSTSSSRSKSQTSKKIRSDMKLVDDMKDKLRYSSKLSNESKGLLSTESFSKKKGNHEYILPTVIGKLRNVILRCDSMLHSRTRWVSILMKQLYRQNMMFKVKRDRA